MYTKLYARPWLGCRAFQWNFFVQPTCTQRLSNPQLQGYAEKVPEPTSKTCNPVKAKCQLLHLQGTVNGASNAHQQIYTNYPTLHSYQLTLLIEAVHAYIAVHIDSCRLASGFHIEPDAIPRSVSDEAVVHQAPPAMFDGIQGEGELLQQPDQCDDTFLHGKLVTNTFSRTHPKGNVSVWMASSWTI